MYLIIKFVLRRVYEYILVPHFVGKRKAGKNLPLFF